MKTTSVLLATLASAPTALAHTVWSVLYVDGLSQGDGAAIRMRQDPKFASFPVEDYASDDIACNVDGTKGVNFVSSIKEGSTLTFEMRSWPDDTSKQPLDRPHHGPCAVYLKKVDSAIKDGAAGDGWFKLMDDGYHADSDTWCTDRLIDNKGRLSVEIPKGLQGGYYLARPEVVALHNATVGAAQFYTGCGQIFVESTGDLVPESTIAIPGPEYVTAGQSSVHFDIYNGDNSKYQVPGPAVANFTHGASASGAQTKQEEGLVPEDCIAQNANWCGKEVASYTDETGCWASGEDCWKQGDACWAAAPPTGGKVCELWNAKCQGINDGCKAKQFSGPPKKGEVLTPKRETIDIGLIIPVVGGGNVDSSPSAPSPSQEASSAAPKESSAAPSAFPSVPAPALDEAAYEPTTAADSPSVTEAPSSTEAAASFKETPTFSSSVSLLSFAGGVYDAPAPSPASQDEAAAYEVAPAPTKAAEQEQEGGRWRGGVVTKWREHYVTETVYVTVSA